MKELVAKINAEYEVFAANAAAQVEKGNKAAGMIEVLPNGPTQR